METITLKHDCEAFLEIQESSLKLMGNTLRLELKGDENFLQITQTVPSLTILGKNNLVEIQGSPRQVFLTGSGNRVRIFEKPGQARPQVHVQGKNHAVTFTKPP